MKKNTPNHLTFGEPGSLGVTCLEPPNNPLLGEGQPPPKQGDLNSNQNRWKTPFGLNSCSICSIPTYPGRHARPRSECYHFHAVVASLHCAPSNLRFVDGCYPPVVGPVGAGRSLPTATVKLGEVSNGLKEVTVR